jgi:hypothetical protein
MRMGVESVFKDEEVVSLCEEVARGERVPSKNGALLLHAWFLIYMFIGCQMSWLLSPFIGRKELPFEVFALEKGDFFSAVIRAVRALASGAG